MYSARYYSKSKMLPPVGFSCSIIIEAFKGFSSTSEQNQTSYFNFTVSALEMLPLLTSRGENLWASSTSVLLLQLMYDSPLQEDCCLWQGLCA